VRPAQAFPVESAHCTEQAVAELNCTLDDRVEHRLHIHRRTADHPEDLARRRLLLQRFGHLRVGLRERTVLFLELREQPHVLDGDDRLVGKGLEQCDLLVGEGTRLSLVDVDRADWQAVAQQWDGRDAPEVSDRCDDLEFVLRICRQVGNLHDLPRQDSATGSKAPAGSARIHVTNSLSAFRADGRLRDKVQKLTVEGRYETAVGATQTHGGLGDSIEDGLNVRGRARNDAEDLARRRLLLQGFGQITVASL
jgi:hypothetical protein